MKQNYKIEYLTNQEVDLIKNDFNDITNRQLKIVDLIKSYSITNSDKEWFPLATEILIKNLNCSKAVIDLDLSLIKARVSLIENKKGKAPFSNNLVNFYKFNKTSHTKQKTSHIEVIDNETIELLKDIKTSLADLVKTSHIYIDSYINYCNIQSISEKSKEEKKIEESKKTDMNNIELQKEINKLFNLVQQQQKEIEELKSIIKNNTSSKSEVSVTPITSITSNSLEEELKEISKENSSNTSTPSKLKQAQQEFFTSTMDCLETSIQEVKRLKLEDGTKFLLNSKYTKLHQDTKNLIEVAKEDLQLTQKQVEALNNKNNNFFKFIEGKKDLINNNGKQLVKLVNQVTPNTKTDWSTYDFSKWVKENEIETQEENAFLFHCYCVARNTKNIKALAFVKQMCGNEFYFNNLSDEFEKQQMIKAVEAQEEITNNEENQVSLAEAI